MKGPCHTRGKRQVQRTAELVAGGKSDAEIAAIMGIQPSTVKSYKQQAGILEGRYGVSKARETTDAQRCQHCHLLEPHICIGNIDVYATRGTALGVVCHARF